VEVAKLQESEITVSKLNAQLEALLKGEPVIGIGGIDLAAQRDEAIRKKEEKRRSLALEQQKEEFIKLMAEKEKHFEEESHKQREHFEILMEKAQIHQQNMFDTNKKHEVNSNTLLKCRLFFIDYYCIIPYPYVYTKLGRATNILAGRKESFGGRMQSTA
jgi:hypothetical protein